MEPARVEEAQLRGLSPEEARARLAAVGPNRLVAVERWAWLKEVLSVVADPMALMLAFASVVYLLLGKTKDAVILAAALVPVMGVDVLLEARSRSALRKLAGAVRPRARVIRGGEEREVPTEELVPGDLVVLAEGDVLHADGAVRRARNLTVDESQLTGESEPQAKSATAGEPGDEPERFYAGSLVLAGSGLGEVTRTGPRTRFGAIARLVAESAPDPTPMQRRTGRLVRQLGAVALAVAAALFALELRRGVSLGQSLLAAVSLAMAAMPEEFPLVFTLFLSLGAWRLSRRGVLVRRLASIETLGSTTVICTDKTGTVTTGQFTLAEQAPLGEGVGEDALLEAALLACEPEPVDPMERAIAARAGERRREAVGARGGWRLVRDHDFDPVGKHMSHVWRVPGGARERVAAKGALEGILQHCRLGPGERERAEARNAELARRGMRVLAVAGREGPPGGGAREEDEAGLRLLGLLGFRDPLRPEVPAAVAECATAGIQVKLVTGDHALTAHAIAEAAGIPGAGGPGLTGEDLDRLAPGALASALRRAAVLARIRPEQKHAIVEALARDGEVVAMTGDGINDAPALRRADIGISLGRRGTEVARAAADLVLLDDDFTSLVATVREGRAIYQNIQRAFLYLIAFHIPVIGVALAAPLLGLPLLFQPVHMVWLELIVHPVSALVFEAEPPPPDLMIRPPRRRGASLLAGALTLKSILSGAILTVGAIWIYRDHLGMGVAYARSLGLTVVIAGSMLLVWAERGVGGSWLGALLPRGWRFWLVWGPVALTLPAFMYFRPAAEVFEIVPLTGSDWLLALALAASGVFWRIGGGRRG
ncbi:cation-translocating P-type ATPase [Anaeromyxobacter paludicola]|uniref:ATPase n=1 Tax=Anaeromyxobacter paludicola TaxID=2918171 RepID=A0ABN6N6N8_9BACT|nr:cation-translocating P-type ATPase [Anaeromyxobacter paludicola]BDG08706.1 ATPase [Anaeromyxobacter paludicola]